ncbi:MAG: YceI family protein [Bryobacteraceae bacterium]|nr:YceI family protein [Bryobacteraceae bacterium]
MRWTRVTAAGVLLAGAIAAQEWEIDSAHSSVQFAVRHMMVATVRGQFGKLTGKVRWDPAKPSEARVEAQVEVGSIDTREPKRDAHLRSPDFFDAEKFPTMTFRSTSVTPVGPGRYRLSGELTIRGITRPVVFEVEGPGQPVRGMGGELRTGATATAKINRKDFGITWNRVLDTGGVAIGEDVAITVDVALVQKTAR